MSWLLHDGTVLAAAEVANSRRARRRGLIGRSHLDGAFVIRPCRQVHTLAMRFAIDVAFCDAEGNVLATATLKPWRVSRFVRRSAFVVETEAHALDRWRIGIGDQLELAETPPAAHSKHSAAS